MMFFYYVIIIGVIYLIFQTWVNYRIDKIDLEISREILFSTFKYRK